MLVTCQGLPAGHQCKNILADLGFLIQAALALVWILQFCMRTYLFQGRFMSWWKLCLQDGMKQNQALSSPASSLLQLHLFLVYRATASQWWMGQEPSSTFPTTTSRSGIGHWRLQPQVSIKWYIANVPWDGFSGKTQKPYFDFFLFFLRMEVSYYL